MVEEGHSVDAKCLCIWVGKQGVLRGCVGRVIGGVLIGAIDGVLRGCVRGHIKDRKVMVELTVFLLVVVGAVVVVVGRDGNRGKASAKGRG